MLEEERIKVTSVGAGLVRGPGPGWGTGEKAHLVC